MSVSLCMIVKDEAKTLPRCLDAAHGLYDELVIVDTGSADDTIAIAEARGAKVIPAEYEYPGHKGRWRNLGIDAATGDWIVILDADEIVQDGPGIRQWLHQAAHEITGIHLLFENYDDIGRCHLRWYQLRAWRRGLYRYLYREHEIPLPTQATCDYNEVQLAATVEHRPPQGREVGKSQPMLDRLLEDVEQWPEHQHPTYFLHRQYAIRGEWQECLAWGHRYLEIAGDHDRCECYNNMATAAQNLGDIDEAIEWLHRAAAAQPHRRAWWVRLARIYAQAENWNVASAIAHCALEIWPDQHWQNEPALERDELFWILETCQGAMARRGA